jgi:hypothetical protein
MGNRQGSAQGAGVKVALVAQNKITELALRELRANAAELLAQAEASGALKWRRATAEFADISSDAQTKGR